MRDTKAERLARLLNQLAALGFTYAEAQRLRRIQSTLHRWAEAECNGEIEHDETTGKPVRRFQWRAFGQGPGLSNTRFPIPDRETGALKQLAAIMAAHKGLWAYHQGDPRGCALYVGRKAALKADTNQIVAKATSYGAHIWSVNSATAPQYAVQYGPEHVETLPDTYPTEEAAARAYLAHRKASVPPRDLLPLESYYSRGVAVCD